MKKDLAAPWDRAAPVSSNSVVPTLPKFSPGLVHSYPANGNGFPDFGQTFTINP